MDTISGFNRVCCANFLLDSGVAVLNFIAEYSG